MRAAFLISVLVCGWLAAAPKAAPLSGPNTPHVQAMGGHDDDAPLVTPARASDLVRSLDVRRLQPGPDLARPLLHTSGSVRVPSVKGHPLWIAPPAADLAHALSVAARPLQPRAPPSARS